MCKFYLLLSFFCLPFVYSQRFKNSQNDNDISFVEIYDDSGKMIANTGINSFVTESVKATINNSKTKHLTIVNPLFIDKKIETSDFLNNSVIGLDPVTNVIETVQINSEFKKKKYLILKTYVRSFQINDGDIQYFIDGIVNYYINLKSNKIKVKFISNRSFENKKILKLKENRLTKIDFQVVGAPMLNLFVKYQNLLKKYSLDNSKANENIILVKSEGLLKGNYSRNNVGSNLDLQIISEDNPKIMKGLGVENVLKNYSFTSCYNSDDIKFNDFTTLNFFKETRIYDIKNSKETFFHNIEATHEVFVLDASYSDSIVENGFDNNYSFKFYSNYSDSYWDKVVNPCFKPLAETISKIVESNLTENKSLNQLK